MTAKKFKEKYKIYISNTNWKYLLSKDELKEYHKLVCQEMKIRISLKLGIVDIDEIENIEF